MTVRAPKYDNANASAAVSGPLGDTWLPCVVRFWNAGKSERARRGQADRET